MGQYYMAVNKTKKEYIRPWDIGGEGKLIESCANRMAGIFPYLLRKSNQHGGGDIELEDPKFAGRWAGDEIYLGGCYDESNLYQTAQSAYHNISKELTAEYNEFVGDLELKLLDDDEE